MFKTNLIKIGGHHFTVDYVDGLADSGSTDTSLNKILINKNLAKSNQESTILHEIIEAINAIYDLKLEHQTIQTIEAALYQIYKDNF
ncbi:hypothetical protein MASR2M39_30050 [Ignavibacteriales bacterium]